MRRAHQRLWILGSPLLVATRPYALLRPEHLKERRLDLRILLLDAPNAVEREDNYQVIAQSKGLLEGDIRVLKEETDFYMLCVDDAVYVIGLERVADRRAILKGAHLVNSRPEATALRTLFQHLWS